jgi:anti-sigma regulatory factor (Ser/Thr protein kinase)
LAPRLDDARLVISEVVTNAIRYGATDGRDEIALVIDVDGGRLHVEVEQTLPALDVRPVEQRLSAVEAGGFGLHIVDALSDRWGVEPGPPGCVWFEFRG